MLVFFLIQLEHIQGSHDATLHKNEIKLVSNSSKVVTKQKIKIAKEFFNLSTEYNTMVNK